MAYIKNTDKLVEGSSNLFHTPQRAKAAVQTDLDNLSGSISSEQSARQSADNALDARLDVIEGSGEGSVSKAKLDAQSYADQKVADLVNSAPAVLDTLKELSDALGGDQNFAVTVSNQIGAVDDRVDQEILDRQSAVSGEQTRAQNAENALDARLDVIEGIGEGSVAKAEQDAKDYADGLVSSEQSARQSADNALDGRLDVLEGSGAGSVAKAQSDAQSYADGIVASEQSARESADQALDARLDILEQDETTKAYVDQQVSAEQSARESADSALDGRLDVLEGSGAGSVAKAQSDAQSYADGIVASEQSARESADSALDGRLDVLEGSGAGSVAKAQSDAQSYADGIVSSEQSARQSADSALDGRLDILEGADSVEGSVAKAEKDAKDYADSLNSAMDLRVDALELDPVSKTYVDGEISDLVTDLNQEISNRQSAVSGEASARQSADEALDARLDVIEGLGEGSVAKAEQDAKDYADQKVAALVNSAPAVLDTLKELSDALGGDANFASTLAGQIGALDGRLDSLELDSVTKAYVDSADSTLQSNIDGLFASKTTSDLSEGSNLYYTQARFDSALGAKSTSDLAEGSRLYYTQARFDSAFGGKSTTNLTEGTNLYYTQARFDSAFTAKSTSNLSEGSNLYFTDARAKSASVVNSSSGSQTDQAMSVSAAKSYIDAADNARLKLDGSTVMTGQFLGIPGTAANPGIAFSGYTGSGLWYNTANNTVNVNVSGSNRMAVSASGISVIGSVGVTTTINFGGMSNQNLVWTTDGSGNIGTSVSAGRPNNVYVKTDVIAGGSLQFGGGLKGTISEKSAAYTMTATDYMIGVTSVTGGKVITLPTAASAGAGKMYVVKDQSGAASATNYIRVTCQGSEKVDGASYFEINVPYESCMVYTNGSNWFVI